MRKTWAVAEAALRETSRRRGVIALLMLLPLSLYAIRRGDHTGQSIRGLFLGLSWAVSTAGLFAAVASRGIEPRLRLAGFRSHHLYLGRLAALGVLGAGLAAPLFALIALDNGHSSVRLRAVALAMAFCVSVGAPFGLLIAALLPKELEGTLLLLVMVGMQMMIDPAGAGARLTPLWSTREIGTYAVDHTGSDYLVRGTLHGLVCTVVLALLVAGLAAFRLRRRPHLRLTVPG